MQEIVISTPALNSVIHCGAGAFNKYVKELKDRQIFVVTDSNVNALYGGLIKESLGEVPVYVMKAGEGSKTVKTLIAVLEKMSESGMTRSSLVVALGGGVVGDVAGLAASLYMRGVELVQIPTTLLSQVDSSVGGKTAVDFKGVKNMIGSFYQPGQVIVDPMFLKTLPVREIRCGLGEIIKYGALDGGIYESLVAEKKNLFDLKFLEEITPPCIRHKADVVLKDEKDVGGVRKTLNLGHTTGHAFELYYKRKSHGEFVLIGTYYELFIAERLGVCSKEYADSIRSLIRKVIGKIPAYQDAAKAAEFARFDKKNKVQSTVSIVVPAKVGSPQEIKLPIEEYIKQISACAEDIRSKS